VSTIKKWLMTVLVGVTAVAGLTACGGTTTYTPAAYGQTYGGAFHCYFVDDPAEATALIAAGLCQPHSVATVMPLWWHEEYYPYYSSPAYYGRYVPANHRTVFIHTQTTFGRTYSSAIRSYSSRAVYKSSTGGTRTGNKIGKAEFGSGTSFGGSGQRYGGGSARGGSRQRTTTGTGRRSGSTSRTGSGGYRGGFGGGSARSGSRR
jgi:uncharacterized membrane protein YgcG